MRKSQRILCFALVLLFALSGMASCKAEPTGSDTTEAPTAAEPTQGQSEEESDSLPEGLDFDGEALNLLIRVDFNEEFFAEEETGDIINDAIYNRNRTVEEQLNMKINLIQGQTWDKWTQTEAQLKSSILAGDKAYDLVADWSIKVPAKILDNQYMDISKLPYLDLSKPWWNSMLDETRVAGKLFFATGDLTTTVLTNASVIYFNKKMQQDYDIPDLYNVVDEGKWTIDYMNQISKDIYKDLNGDGKKDNGDVFGIALSPYNVVDGFLQSSNIKMTKKDSQGLPVFEMEYDKLATLVSKVYTLLYENDGAFTVKGEGLELDNQCVMFGNDQLLLLPMIIGTSYQFLRDMESDYGILPYPKFDEAQEGYYTKVFSDAESFMCVPVNCDKTELVGAFLEAAAYESNRSVVPALYEVALKVKFSRDEISARMLDIIREGIYFNFTSMYSATIGDPWSVMRELMSTKSKDFASWYEKKEKIINQSIEKVVSQIEEME